MRTRTSCFLLGVLGLAAAARATPTVTVGSYTMAPNSTATFGISVSDPGSASAEDIEGMTFTLQLGSGSGSTPSITSVDFLNNTVWTGSISSAVPEASGGKPEFVSYDPITDNGGEFISANGTLANVTFNTAGVTSGSSFSLTMTGFSNTDDDSSFTNGSGDAVVTAIASGTLHVQSSVVPEPADCALLAAAALLLPWRLRRPFSAAQKQESHECHKRTLMKRRMRNESD